MNTLVTLIVVGLILVGMVVAVGAGNGEGNALKGVVDTAVQHADCAAQYAGAGIGAVASCLASGTP